MVARFAGNAPPVMVFERWGKGRRATIKAHSTPPLPTRPYSSPAHWPLFEAEVNANWATFAVARAWWLHHLEGFKHRNPGATPQNWTALSQLDCCVQ